MAEVIHEESQLNGSQEHDASHQRQDSGVRPAKRRGSVDRDAQEMVIESLRTQIQDLISQVSQLNSKLVKSYDRVSDLEDDLHVASASMRSSSLKISQLELERTQHLAALNTGLLVEKTHVTAELNRLMERATEEAAQRGQAESARVAIEKDLDDLSASLFGQANLMVAEARFEKHLSEQKVESAEQALKSAEEAVQIMQTQMQSLQAGREEAEKRALEMEMLMGKGKWVARRDSDAGSGTSLRFINCHGPYLDYLAFIAHLRVLHPSSPTTTPAMSTLLQLPFLARLLTEDSEPTIRLDLAPSLNWLSRRSVLSAIHSGYLIIEPMSVGTLFAESTTQPTSVAGVNSSNDNISCALCGVSIFPSHEPTHSSRPPVHPSSQAAQSQLSSSTWSVFKRPLSGSTQPHSPIQRSLSNHFDTQIFIFRLAQSTSSTTITVSLPIPTLSKSSSQSSSTPVPSNPSTGQIHHSNNIPNSHGSTPNNQPTTIYPLCMSGWCLNRLRTTCTMWAFVRTGIVDKIWEEELPPPPPSPTALQVDKNARSGTASDKPPVPPRKRGIWGGIASAIGERAASWGEGDKEKAKKATATYTPPPLPPVNPARSSHPTPPPLPKRNEGRSVTPHINGDHNTTSTILSSINPSAAAGVPISSSVSAPESIIAPPLPVTTEVFTPTTPRPVSTSTSSEHPLPPVAPLSPIRRSHLRNASAGTPPPPLPPRHARSPPPPPSSGSGPPATTLSAAILAANIPLPESRPETPAHAAASPVNTEPSRTSSPAVTTTAGGAPPPIPRRAAARVARAPPGTPGGVSRPLTPANVDAAASSAASGPSKEENRTIEEAGKKEKTDGTKSELDDLNRSTSNEFTKVDPVESDQEAKAGTEELPSVSSLSTSTNSVDSYKSADADNGPQEKDMSDVLAVPDRPAQASPVFSNDNVLKDAVLPEQQDTSSMEGDKEKTEESGKTEKEGSQDKTKEYHAVGEIMEETEQDENDKATIAAHDTPLASRPVSLPEPSSPTTTTLNSGTSVPDSTVPVHINGVKDDIKSKQTESDVDVSPQDIVVNGHIDSVREEEEENQRKEQEDKNKGRFLGDSTWEERTWKEIVRLREDMFWARVGGVKN